MVKRAYIIDEDELHMLRLAIIEAIITDAKKGYGCKFVSHDDGEELEDMAMRGQLIMSIDKVWPK